jgi:hypothetical protein
MFPSLRSLEVVASFLAVSMIAGCSLLSNPSGVRPDMSLPTQIRAHPLLHEALVASSSGHPRHPLDVLYPPPSPLPEQPSGVKPAGDDVVWVAGYWVWDTNEDNWHWIPGLWIHAPPGRHWIPGYWSIVADGWRWIPGSWAIDPPPPPPAPPPAYAYSPSGYYSSPAFGFFTGYGMWWPGYSYWPYYHWHHRGEIVPPVLSPSSHAAEPRSFPLPALASNVHEAPSIPLDCQSATPPLRHLAPNVHEAPSLPSQLHMASDFASVPKPLASSFDSHTSFELHTAHPMFALSAGSQEHSERISSLFSTAAHMDTTLHEHLISHGNFATHSLSSVSGHASSSHASGGHGGSGHGR